MDEVVFSYPGIVTDITYDAHGKPMNVSINVSINVSVNGKNYLIISDISLIDFEVYVFSPVVVEGLKNKKVVIKKPEPVFLSKEAIELLRNM